MTTIESNVMPVTAETVSGLPDQPLEGGVEHIADTASITIVDALSADKLLHFAAVARESADDYRRWAVEFPKLAEYYTKCANDRQSDADRYECEGLRKITLSEAAE